MEHTLEIMFLLLTEKFSIAIGDITEILVNQARIETTRNILYTIVNIIITVGLGLFSRYAVQNEYDLYIIAISTFMGFIFLFLSINTFTSVITCIKNPKYYALEEVLKVINKDA